MKKSKSPACLTTAVIASLVALQGCVATLFNLPTPEEIRSLLENHLNESMRVAVVTTQFASHELPLNGFGEYLVSDAAQAVQDVFGVEAVAIDQREGGEWAQELARVRETGGRLNGETHAEYFRARGFDAWVVVSTKGEGAFAGVEGGNAAWVYDPSTRIFTVDGSVHRNLLYWSSKRYTAACAIQARLIFNYKKKFTIVYPEKCAAEVAETIRRELTEAKAL